jgi:hypothetical protein
MRTFPMKIRHQLYLAATGMFCLTADAQYNRATADVQPSALALTTPSPHRNSEPTPKPSVKPRDVTSPTPSGDCREQLLQRLQRDAVEYQTASDEEDAAGNSKDSDHQLGMAETLMTAWHAIKGDLEAPIDPKVIKGYPRMIDEYLNDHIGPADPCQHDYSLVLRYLPNRFPQPVVGQ